eukprot:NODE_4759_length_765_cov_31.406425_g4411_i0.p1 GENE.NODE_4759_length_765_cov_31.406425_g4411_i0~~NODE_4759_length_765_cov_31.406425_g4411_i0.p1  ORF type:complete len:182 (-),score=42.97 NODE_4759_length_765_cov_31.406425_g4411_i0:86-631(-)
MDIAELKEQLAALETLRPVLTEQEYTAKRASILSIPANTIVGSPERALTSPVTSDSNVFSPSSSRTSRSLCRASLSSRSERSRSGSQTRTRAGIVDDEWLHVTITMMKEKMSQRYSTPRAAFMALDVQRLGFVGIDDVAKRLETFNLGVDADQLGLVANHLDYDKDGRVSFADWNAIFRSF